MMTVIDVCIELPCVYVPGALSESGLVARTVKSFPERTAIKLIEVAWKKL